MFFDNGDILDKMDFLNAKVDDIMNQILELKRLHIRDTSIIEDLINDRTRNKSFECVIERQKISKRDKCFLEYLNEKYKYIARDKDEDLYFYTEKPEKSIEEEYEGWNGYAFKITDIFGVNFPMIKWEDEEPWSIEDLKKLEVVDEYENN